MAGVAPAGVSQVPATVSHHRGHKWYRLQALPKPAALQIGEDQDFYAGAGPLTSAKMDSLRRAIARQSNLSHDFQFILRGAGKVGLDDEAKALAVVKQQFAREVDGDGNLLFTDAELAGAIAELHRQAGPGARLLSTWWSDQSVEAWGQLLVAQAQSGDLKVLLVLTGHN